MTGPGDPARGCSADRKPTGKRSALRTTILSAPNPYQSPEVVAPAASQPAAPQEPLYATRGRAALAAMRRGARFGTRVLGLAAVGIVVLLALVTVAIATRDGLTAEKVAERLGHPGNAGWLGFVAQSIVMLPLMVILYGTLPGAVVGAVVGAVTWRRPKQTVRQSEAAGVKDPDPQ